VGAAAPTRAIGLRQTVAAPCAGREHVGSELGRALRALTPSAKVAAEAALTTDEATSEYLYDCVLAARSVDELAECHWDP
jgi:hypothetical protein